MTYQISQYPTNLKRISVLSIRLKKGKNMLQRQIVTWVLGTMKHGMVKQIIVEILWELASRTDNTLDDKMVEIVGDALGVDIN